MRGVSEPGGRGPGWMAAVLLLYPAPFRRRFGAPMVDAFRSRVSEVRRTRGRLAALVTAAQALAGMATSGLAERRFERRRHRHTLFKGSLMQNLISDIRLGVRQLRRAPSFTLAATLVLALGIGSTVAAFGVFNTVFLQTELDRSDDVVGLYCRDTSRQGEYVGISFPTLVDLRSREGLFDGVAGQTFTLAGLREGEITRRMLTGIVTAGFFDTLGAPLQLGRDFSATEEAPAADIPVAILGHQLWQRLGASPTIIGQTLEVNARTFTVIGVARAGFRGTSTVFGPELWLPTGMYDTVTAVDVRDDRRLGDRRNGALMAVVKVPEGRDQGQQVNRLAAATRDLATSYPAVHGSHELLMAPLSTASVGTRPDTDGAVRSAVISLVALAALVMFVSALNVANMQLARAAVRRKEMAVRLALGGSRARLVRQLMTEGLLLALCGGVMGAVVASVVGRWLAASVAEMTSRVVQVELRFDPTPDATVWMATFGLSVLCMLAFSVVPALRASRRDVAPELAHHLGELRGATGARGAGLLVAGQLALSLVLLTVSGLFVKMAVTAANSDPGFSLDRGVLAQIDPGQVATDSAGRREIYARVLQTVRTMPGVEVASLASLMPFGDVTTNLNIQRNGEAAEAANASDTVSTVWTQVGADYFKSLGLAMVAGREFDDADERRGTDAHIILDQAVADQLFPGENPIGQLVHRPGDLPGDPLVPMEVIGIAAPIRHQQTDLSAGPHAYTLYTATTPGSAYLTIRAAGGSAEADAALVAPVRAQLRATFPELPLLGLQTFSQYGESTMVLAMLRLGAGAFVGFAVMALLIASVGVYGVKSYLVSSRTREIGIRVTLGATRGSIFALVLRQGLGVTMLGVGTGVVLSWLVSQAAQGVVLNSGAFDVMIFGSAALALGVSVLLASWVPARRAVAVSAATFTRA